MTNEIARDLFYKALQKIIRLDSDMSAKISAEMELLVHLSKEAVKDTGIQFHTLFSIIAYTGHRYSLPRKLIYNIHRFRKQATSSRTNSNRPSELEDIYQLGLKVLCDTIQIIHGGRPSTYILENLPSTSVFDYREEQVAQFKKYQRVLVIDKIEQEEMLLAIDQSRVDEQIRIRYNLTDRNEDFNQSIALLGNVLPLPIEVNLIDIEIDKQGIYLPKAFVIEPDFLVDITAVADASKDKGVGGASYLIKKFLPVPANKYIMLGHIANFFLDELMADASLDFRSLINRVFHLNPVAFSLFDDGTSREVVQSAQKHFVNLQMVIRQSLPKHGIDVQNCFLEPTFYAERYGLQGRLDVLHDNPAIVDDAAIIELKSGSPYRPNVYGLSHNHYIQTLLYDLLIKSVSDDKLRPTNYILYSGKDVDHLRFAPAVRSQQYQALAVRNLLVGIERRLAYSLPFIEEPEAFLRFLSEGENKARGFLLRDINILKEKFSQLTRLEQKYFLAMVGLVAREHHLAKVGLEGERRNNGQASLWLNSADEKEAEFNILRDLQIGKNATQENEPTIALIRTSETNPLANFRKGDLAVLYPQQKEKSPLHSQLFKGTIVEIDQRRIVLRLRAKQFNDRIFQSHPHWSLEHDSLDSSFNGLYRALFSFADFDIRKRHQFLTLKAPSPPISCPWSKRDDMTDEQNQVIKKMLEAQDFFLLWGPPGTGKTSVMLRHLVEYLLKNSDEKILLVAYTNRAVDEICRALDAIDSGVRDKYVRIGSRYSTHPDFAEQLLTTKMHDISTRESLRALFKKQRMIVGTASSIVGKSEIFQLVAFDRIIVDEATQMLEPMMAGLLPRFKKSILIGDHRQLAAVVTQSRQQRETTDEELGSIGIADLGDSYFERVYRRYQQEEWHWAFAKLSHQGRMHADIMEFPREYFYDGTLDILPTQDKEQPQKEPLSLETKDQDKLTRILAQHRVVFLAVSSRELYTSKTNADEAHLVGKILQRLQKLHAENNRPLALDEIGIITPFRAQIAKIREELITINTDPNDITIDTVERFQGGARRIIIISLCVNSPNQLQSLISKSSEGLDRKLNVALTRAREQLILIGDPEVLGSDSTYKAYMDRYTRETENGCL